MVEKGCVAVTDDTDAAVARSDLSLVCVGTPSRRNGSLETGHLERVIDQIGHALAQTSSYHVVAIRSTVLPGVWSSCLVPLLERACGRRVGADLGFCINPEFLREGSAIKAGDLLLSLYAHVKAPVHRIHPDEASMIKYASNNFHAVKVAFSNEIGALCHEFGIDGQTVMQIFCEDRDLNISPRYLRPGFGFGGSCLPKDLRAVLHAAKERDVATPLLGSVLTSNDAHIQRVVDAVLEMRGRHPVALLGLSFKAGSDDLRESPFVRLAESLIGKGVPLHIYDPDVMLSEVFGRNRAYMQEHLPHVGQLLATDFEDVVRGADVVIVGKRFGEIERLNRLLQQEQTVIDLVGISDLKDAIRPWSTMRKDGRAVTGSTLTA
jgi:GDP-mannose 6-dehydrogenase